VEPPARAAELLVRPQEVRVLEPLDINGEPPALTGVPCDELLVQQYWYRGELVEPANVVYLRFAGGWHRLYFDSGIVFWRPHDRAPEAVSPGQEEFAYPLVDLGRQFGVRGVMLDRMEATPIEGGSEVRLGFGNGVVVVFSDIADTTTYRAEPGAAADRAALRWK
jgi:hypothetical protein